MKENYVTIRNHRNNDQYTITRREIRNTIFALNGITNDYRYLNTTEFNDAKRMIMILEEMLK